MKKLLALALALVMVLGMGACSDTGGGSSSGDGSDGGGSGGGSGKVGICMPTNSLERWNRDGAYLQEQFEAAGYEVELKYSDNNETQQNNDIASMIADDVDLLIISAINGEALTQTLADAGDIPVIAYDRLIMNSEAISYYVSFDNYTVGKLQAQYIIDTLGLDVNDTSKTYNMEITAGDPADNNAPFFYNGAMDTLKPFIDAGIIKIPSGQTTFEQTATEKWDTATALERMQNILGSYYSDGQQLDIALCSNDSTALGVVQAIDSDYAGSNTPLVTGQDGDEANLKNIVDGKQAVTIYKNVSDEAAVTLELSKKILAGEEPGEDLLDSLDVECSYDTESYDNGTGIVPSYLLVPFQITKDNLQDLVDTGLYKWDDENKYLVAIKG